MHLLRRTLIAVCCIVAFSAVFIFAAADISLTLDEEIIETEAAPVIIDSRTLVPVRALFEAMGGSVDWDPKTEKVTVQYDDTTVIMTVGSKNAKVNGTDQTMDVAAQILPSGRTYIPVRFAASSLGFGVDWDDENRTVSITSPGYTKEEPTLITDITTEHTDTDYRVVIEFSGPAPSLKSSAFVDPDRYVTDLWTATVQIGEYQGGSGAVEAGNPVFAQVRYSQFTEDTVRIVCDLNGKVAGKISINQEKGELYIDFDDPDAVEIPEDNTEENPGATDPEEDPEEEIPDSTLPALDWRMSGKLVLIDAGHGGTDPGCLVKYNGITYHESTFNLKIALSLYEMLKEAGANVQLLRSTDETVKLLQRPALANQMMADLYVSIHNNSSISATPSGTEVFYYAKSTESSYDLTSKELAQNISQTLTAELGLANRGITSQGAYAVLNKTNMPAVIVEGAFFSNAKDLALMMSSDYTELYATGVACGIIQALNQAAEE